MKRAGRLSPTSRKRKADRVRRAQVRQAVFERDGGCVLSPFGLLNRHGNDWGPCLGPLTFHHVLKASQGGEYSMANGKAVCRMHNDMIEDHWNAAEAIGLVTSGKQKIRGCA